jgi:hypothetical protein
MQFLKSQCHHKKQEGGCKDIQVQLTKDNFELLMSEQESPLMNKDSTIWVGDFWTILKKSSFGSEKTLRIFSAYFARKNFKLGKKKIFG